MEKNFYTDDFESFLKDTADNFRMYPSKKVWHGLYNDLHPGRRWPSLAVCLLLITAILFIGISNNNSINNISHLDVSANILAKSKRYMSTGNATPLKDNAINLASNSTYPANTNKKAADLYNPSANNYQTDLSTTASGMQVNHGIESEAASPSTTFSKEDGISQTELALVLNIVPLVDNNMELKTRALKTGKEITKLNLVNNPPLKNIDINVPHIKDIAKFTVADRSWIEDYAFHNKAAVSKWKTHAVFQYYITPSVGFRKLNKNNELPSGINATTALLVTNTVNPLPLKDKVSQSSAANLETGGMVLYSLSKNLRLKGGFQFNYTNYNVAANELKHPNQTTLLLNDLNTGAAILEPRISFYANSTTDEDKKQLKNNTLQLSIPIGADYKLAGKNNLKWYAGATLQPSFIAGGHLYALSADEKNYIEDPTLLRKWNLNASLETFLSYKTINGVIISAGPQFRYQFLSTYDKRFTYTEKLYNFGVKLGITTNF
ncbi:MAG: hypothetical protein ABJA37_04020 [Ferruginibacter sp.]